jgi:hypothetical protein
MTGASDESILTALTLGRMSEGEPPEPGAAIKVNPAGGLREVCAAAAASQEHTSASAASGAPALGVKALPRNRFPQYRCGFNSR